MDHIASQMRNIVLGRRDNLNKINDKDTIYVNYNGQYWKGRVVTVRKHAIAFPEFRVRLDDNNRLDWVSGVQVFTESEIPPDCVY